MQVLNGEQWRALKIDGIDTNEKFEISNLGKLRSFKHKEEGELVRPSNIKGYPILNVKLQSGKRTTRYIHKLVAETFLDKNSNDQEYVIHLDFIKENNHYRNLRWANRSELFAHQAKNPNYKKGIIRYSKLSETDVIRLKKKIQRGKNPLYKIAKEFGITHTQLNRIRSGENWSHVKIE